ncbi:M23 family metallopeptidase [uncultured Arthrobacter sp.]|uniref:M23 family metallopeptidase n=1 Tax=uncultured Arthrobacter sp. TaxID=114050 RepID=UPI002632095B|nr:peptidoglycan DD-metalloendopeptidase family protein [uncultured Arthrobacter sp.]
MTLGSTGLLLAALASSGTVLEPPANAGFDAGTVGIAGNADAVPSSGNARNAGNAGTAGPVDAVPASGTVTPSPGTAAPPTGAGSGAAPGVEARTGVVTAAHLTSDPERAIPAVGPRPLVSPVEDPVLASPFGYRMDPVDGVSVELHTGLDYAAPCGTAVTAAGPGTVLESGWHAYGGGLRVLVDHGDGLRTTYNHLGSLEVGAGTVVRSGDLLGRIGSTGNSTGCHLHFEVIVQDGKVDPLPWL